MPTKQEYMQIINEKMSERAESREKSKETRVGGSGENEVVDSVSTKRKYD
jgi:hypothetical protein